MAQLSLFAVVGWLAFGPAPGGWAELAQEREAYRAELAAVRADYGGARKLPPVDFFLFGMGSRAKFVYKSGTLSDAVGGKAVRRWDVADELIVPSVYTVALRTKTGAVVTIREGAAGLVVTEGGKSATLADAPVNLPEFAGKRYPRVLKVLHQEMLVNLVDSAPLPSCFVYKKPWYRDAAMVGMCLQKTGNLALIKPWVAGLRVPFDKNNNGESEADNPGELLYLISLTHDRTHPAVPAALAALQKFEKGGAIVGRSDFRERPVYQTRWANFGLAALGLPTKYVVPAVADDYAPLAWWGDRAGGVKGERVMVSDDYPYLTWAGSHALGTRQGKFSDRDYPLTWEAKASQADYAGMKRVDPAYVAARICAPHTWHSAEAFLALLGRDAD